MGAKEGSLGFVRLHWVNISSNLVKYILEDVVAQWLYNDNHEGDNDDDQEDSDEGETEESLCDWFDVAGLLRVWLVDPILLDLVSIEDQLTFKDTIIDQAKSQEAVKFIWIFELGSRFLFDRCP